MKAQQRTLDSLLSESEPNGTFHDSSLLSWDIDLENQVLIATFNICVGNPEADSEKERERWRRGQLRVDGVKVWEIEPCDPKTFQPLWVHDDGLLGDCSTDRAKVLVKHTGPDDYAWYIFFGQQNAFAYIMGRRAQFLWQQIAV